MASPLNQNLRLCIATASAAERPSSAAAASVTYEVPETNKAAAVCCSGWFGVPFVSPLGQTRTLVAGLELRRVQPGERLAVPLSTRPDVLLDLLVGRQP